MEVSGEVYLEHKSLQHEGKIIMLGFFVVRTGPFESKL
jgi:hypothetical protein